MCPPQRRLTAVLYLHDSIPPFDDATGIFTEKRDVGVFGGVEMVLLVPHMLCSESPSQGLDESRVGMRWVLSQVRYALRHDGGHREDPLRGPESGRKPRLFSERFEIHEI